MQQKNLLDQACMAAKIHGNKREAGVENEGDECI